MFHSPDSAYLHVAVLMLQGFLRLYFTFSSSEDISYMDSRALFLRVHIHVSLEEVDSALLG